MNLGLGGSGLLNLGDRTNSDGAGLWQAMVMGWSRYFL